VSDLEGEPGVDEPVALDEAILLRNPPISSSVRGSRFTLRCPSWEGASR
jgi:hypothetical protein